MVDAVPVLLPRVPFMDLVRVAPGWRQQPHQHPYHEICFVHQGRGFLHGGGREIPISRGSIYLFLPGEAHGGLSSEDAPLQILYLAVSFPQPVRVLREASAQPFFLCGPRAQSVRPMLSTIARALARGPQRANHAPVGEELLAPVLGVVAAMVEPVAELAAGSQRQRDLAGQAAGCLRSARTLPTLGQLARQLGLSPAHLGELLGRATGCTYPTLLAHERLRRARELLLDEDLPLREIAKRVGVSGTPALTRMFRRLTGRPPGAYRPSCEPRSGHQGP